LPRHGCLNVHASLLPRHRGAAPIAAAILAGDTETGITLMQMDAGLDTGPLLAARRELIHPADTTETLSQRLADLGAELLIEALPRYLAGELRPQPQDEALATYAPQLKKEEGRLDFTRPAPELERRVRALDPWPGAFALWQGLPLKILRAELLTETEHHAPGEVYQRGQELAVACGTGALELLEVQPAGKKPMPAADFARGARGFIGARLT
jgi:methionyl-tRNA formyltransferase